MNRPGSPTLAPEPDVGIDRALVEAVRTRIDATRPLPRVARELALMGRDSDVPVAEIVAVLDTDQGVAAQLLRVANSSFFGLSHRVASTRHAVIVLGLSGVRNLAIGLATFSDRAGSSGSRAVSAIGLNDHALAVAIVSRKLAAVISPGLADEAFLAGLLHDVGRPILEDLFPAEYRQAVTTAARRGGGLAAIEADQFGIDHAAVGQILADAWNLPGGLAGVIGRHHAPSDDAVTTGDAAANLLAVRGADALTKIVGVGDSGDAGIDGDAITDLLDAGVTFERLASLAGDLPEELATCRTLFATSAYRATVRPRASIAAAIEDVINNGGSRS